MSDNKDKKKKGFFARLFGSSDAPKDSNNKDTSSKEINETPSLSAVKKMKKADIVDSAKVNGLDLDINLTKAKLIEAWELHFNPDSVSSTPQKEKLEEAPEEEAPAEETPVEETPVEETTEEEVPAEEAPAEEAPEEEAPAEEESIENDSSEDEKK